MIVVNNVKFHTIISGPRLKVFQEYYKLSNSPYITKRKKSFIILRLNQFVYTCFLSGFINITGVKKLEYIHKAIDDLAFHLGISTKDFTEFKIDNIHASCNIPHTPSPVNINRLVQILSCKKVHFIKEIRFNRQKFPGLTLRTDKGSILWFSSNRILLTGCKSEQDLDCSQRNILFLQELWTNVVDI